MNGDCRDCREAVQDVQESDVGALPLLRFRQAMVAVVRRKDRPIKS